MIRRILDNPNEFLLGLTIYAAGNALVFVLIPILGAITEGWVQ